jgi:hypothetical protein
MRQTVSHCREQPESARCREQPAKCAGDAATPMHSAYKSTSVTEFHYARQLIAAFTNDLSHAK